MKTAGRDLALLLKTEYYSKNFPLFKSEEELVFLCEWMEKPAEIRVAQAPELSIDEMIESCNRCPGITVRKKGIGTGRSGVLVVLNAPGMIDPLEMNVFKKDSASLLKKMLEAINLDLSDCYVTNLIKCESSDSFVKPSEMLERCIGIFRREIAHFNPEIVIVMGDIKPLQNIIHESRNVFWFNTSHPVTLIKNPGMKRDAWNTLKLVLAKYKELNSSF